MGKRIRLLHLPVLVCFLLAFLLAPLHGRARAQGGEYRVKAAFLFNFIKFAEWPPADSDTIALCVLGENPFGESLDILKGKSAGGQRISVRYASSTQNVKGCHLLFIAASEKDHLSQILKVLDGLPLLTVGDTEGFARKGVMINMYIEDERVHFEVNLNAVKRSGVRLDSRLLKLARIVQE